MPEPEPQNSDKIIEKIVSEIEDGKCILIMGPEFYFLNNNEDDEIECIQDHLRSRVVQEPIKYLTNEGLFYCENEEQVSDIVANIKFFFRDLKIHPLYEKIAQIPFTLYISLSPDNILHQTFDGLHLKHQFSWYYPGINTLEQRRDKNKIQISRTNPLVYNLMGIFDEKNSLVFTYEALFSYISTIIQKEYPEKAAIKECLSRASYFLFFGFRFDKWYLKLLFFLFKKELLQTPDDYKSVKKIAFLFKKPDAEDNILSYYKSEFKFEFPTESQKDFLDKLFVACKDKGLLRRSEDQGYEEIFEIRKLLDQRKNNEATRKVMYLNNKKEFDKAIEGLKILFAGQDGKIEEVEKIEGELNYQKNKYLRDRSTEGEYEKNLSKIQERIDIILKPI